jgi:hypothetical protein
MQHSGLKNKRHKNLRKLGAVIECAHKVEDLLNLGRLAQKRNPFFIESLGLFQDVFLLRKEK